MDIPRPVTTQLEVVSRTDLTKKVIHFVFKLTEEANFKPGQFMSVFVADKVRRSYSLCPTETNHQMETYVDISPGGLGSQYFEKLNVGDTVRGIFPLGRFLYQENTSPVVFIATGTGIVPIKSMIIHELFNLKSGREITLLWGFRNQEDIFSYEYFANLANEYPNFTFRCTLSGQDIAGFESGRVTKHVAAGNFKCSSNTDFYICGSRAMIEDTKNILLDKGINEDKIYFEQFYS